MKDHLLPHKLICPACGAGQDGALNTENDRGPQDGDPGICAECRTINVYVGTPVNSLRPPTRSELDEFLADPHVQRCIAAMRVVHERPRR